MKLPIPGYPDYFADSYGCIWHNDDIVEPLIKDRNDNPVVILAQDGEEKYHRIDVLILTTFKGPPPLISDPKSFRKLTKDEIEKIKFYRTPFQQN